MLDFENKGHRPLTALVYEELKMRILTGIIGPGERIMEVETAEDFGVSRTPIREAIRRLEKEGLIVTEERRGSYAAKISEEDLTEILEVRESLEGLAASYAVERMTPEMKDRLEETYKKHKEAVAAGEFSAMIEYDTEFHRIIQEGSCNKTLITLIDQLQELMLRFRHMYYDNSKRAEMIPIEHERILNAIKSGDADRAFTAAQTHIRSLKETVARDGLGGH